jgi:hypothetical protein
VQQKLTQNKQVYSVNVAEIAKRLGLSTEKFSALHAKHRPQ